MTINVGMEQAYKLDLRKSKNVSMEMVAADFLIIQISMTELLSQIFSTDDKAGLLSWEGLHCTKQGKIGG